MKNRFNTYDIVCGVAELQKKLKGLRVNQIYDVDNKTYLIRLQGQGTEGKTVLLIESGARFHTTAFEWPKNVAPSGFSMKLRKHLKNKRLEEVRQLGIDRIVDFQFGTGDVAFHIILELYDRGNIILTDHELTILYVLRPHTEGEEIRFAVREKYPTNRAKQHEDNFTESKLHDLLLNAKNGDSLRQILMPILECGPSVIDHVLYKHKLNTCIIENNNTPVNETNNPGSKKTKTDKRRFRGQKDAVTRSFDIEKDFEALKLAIRESENILAEAREGNSKGYIIRKKEEKPSKNETVKEHFYQNIEFHPYLFDYLDTEFALTFDSFLLAVDEFFSNLEGQKIDMKTLQQERDVLKKLSNVKNDHAKRLEELSKVQEDDKLKAELITSNKELVDKAIYAVQSLIAKQMSWSDIEELVTEARLNKDPVAEYIHQLKLDINHISLKLSNPYENVGSDSAESNDESDDTDDSADVKLSKKLKKLHKIYIVDIDLALSAWANARKYYDLKRYAAKKEQKTIDASEKALKSAEKKTIQALKDVRTISTISKARKVFWFEKFYWFISSENYLVIAGRDAQQNELIVKRYMRPSDIYVHAEIQGASSVVIRNPKGGEIPPKTLVEAGTMAISYSVAWDAKVVTNAYWVYSNQVSKTAPTGEYLGTGSFMIRGKKNFLPTCHLIMGLSVLFKLEDSFVEKHRGERKIRQFVDDDQSVSDLKSENCTENEFLETIEENSILETVKNKSEIKETDTESDNEQPPSFPDTQVKIEHDTGRITLRSDTIIQNVEVPNVFTVQNTNLLDVEDETLIPAAPSRIKQQQQKSKKRKEDKSKNKKKHKSSNEEFDDDDKKDMTQVKRGQKTKLKKIKEKYRDQDEEERKLRMQILKSSGKTDSDANTVDSTDQLIKCSEIKEKKLFLPKEPKQEQQNLDEAEESPLGEIEILDSLTGTPFEEDELLFVIPVVAPYQSLQNYKYKVKLTPGTGKRGKAAKTALTMFSKEKDCSNREKDLFKSLKEEMVARNIPGKVKIAAPQLQKFRSK